jgi:ABC-2 type transport system ATP-binding protein
VLGCPDSEVAKAVDAVDLGSHAGAVVSRLSGGQRSRASLAVALLGSPDLLVLDEPTVGLDVEARRALWKQIRAFIAGGRSVLLTTHYLAEAEALADRVVVIHKGVAMAEGTPKEIKGDAATLEDAFIDLLEAS